MKRILQLGMTDVYGGTEAYLMNQYRNINHSKIEYDFLCVNTGVKKICCADEILKKSKIFYLPFNRKKAPLHTYISYLKWMKKYAEDYDAIVFNMNGLNIVFPLLAYKIFGKGKVIAHSHNAGEMDANMSLLMRFIRRINKFILNRIVDVRFACSNLAGNYLFSNHKYIVIHNAINLDKFQFNENHRKCLRRKYKVEKKFIIGNVGRLSYQKNQEFLIKILYKIKQYRSDTVLFLVGDQSAAPDLVKKIKDMAREYGLTKDVFFIPPQNDINQFYSMFDAFVLPSRFEGLGIVAIEAQVSNLSCICSDGVPEDVNVTGNVKFLSLKDSPDFWAKKILEGPFPKRLSRVADLKKGGYDIKEETKFIENIYQKIL